MDMQNTEIAQTKEDSRFAQTDSVAANARADRRRSTRIPSDVTVKLIDVTRFGDAALEHFNKHQVVDGKEPATGMIGQTWGIVEKPNGDLFCLCTEGVGPDKITDESPMLLDFQPEWKTGGTTRISFTTITATVSREELLECPVTGTKSLEDFIRTFGRRLEENYELWRKELSPVS